MKEPDLDAARDALDDGDPLTALAELEGALAEDPEVALVELEARLELGELRAARLALERASRGLAADDPDRLWLEGQLLLREWRITEAERAFGELFDAAESAAALAALALCRELEGDFTGAEALLLRAHALDSQAQPLPVRLDVADFDRVVQEAMAELPEEFQRAVGALRFLVEPMPGVALARRGDPAEVPPDLLGLFVGPTLGELDEGHFELPVVYLFQRNIERVARDEDELRLEIRTTLYHEIGHFLGHDEGGVEAMGLA